VTTTDHKAILGKGAFGIVYRGNYIDRPVAIKTVVTSSANADTINYTRALLSEIKVKCYLAGNDTMKEHTGKLNIVNLIGASTSSGNWKIIIILISIKILYTYLKIRGLKIFEKFDI